MTKNNNLLSVIVPTYNEIHNIETLVSRIDNSLKGISYEIIIVDDNSPDETGKRAEELSKDYPLRAVHREGKLGLASAFLKGFEFAKGGIIGCMDADLSHPPETIPKLIASINEDGSDIVIASRLIEGGAIAGNWPQKRKINSYVATGLAKFLTPIKDPMSGFFFLKRDVIEGVPLIPRGYKIGLEIIVKGKYKKIKEIPFLFDNRIKGESKLNLNIQLEYMAQILHLYTYRLKRVVSKQKDHS